MKTKKILIEARKVIEDPKNWTQFVGARDINGRAKSANSELACKWCALGAIEKVCLDYTSWKKTVNHLRKIVGPFSVAKFNDSHKHEEVLELFDKAIKRSGNES
jgi:hypothetical protein